MKLTIGFSPCPNDTFIFDALVNGALDTGNLSFEVIMEDVQTLNEMAIEGRIDVTKVSFGSLPLLLQDYIVLNTGAALGVGVGPLLVGPFPVPSSAINECTIAIPGKNTSAHVLFSLAYPDAAKKVFVRYDEVEDFVLNNTATNTNLREVRLGVIIHENRFTYEAKGLHKQSDLGRFWEEQTGAPVPLGGIVARRSLDPKILTQLENLIRQSLAISHRSMPVLSDFVSSNAQEMSHDVMKQHINLYVNTYTDNLGPTGREAVLKFVQVHSSINKIELGHNKIFHD